MTGDLNPVAEMAWAGFLSYLHSIDEVPESADEIWAMKAEFLAGFDE